MLWASELVAGCKPDGQGRCQRRLDLSWSLKLRREGGSKDRGTRKPTASRVGLGYRLSMETSLVSVQDLRIARSGLRKGPEG